MKIPSGGLDQRLADDVVDWVESIGMTLFDWQCDVLRQGLTMNGHKWAAYEVDLIVPRQNGKNELLVALELAAVAVLGKRLIVHSAHEAVTAQKHFHRFQELADRLPEVAKLLPNTKTMGFYTSNGKEHIEFRNGAMIDFRTRTRSAGRGFSADLVVFDEAFLLPPKAVGSLMYTMRARKNAQVWKTSSAPHDHSVVLHADRKRAEADDPNDTRLLYLEWGNEPGVDPSDPECWARSNPSLGLEAAGFALELQTFRNEYASARHDPELLAEFVREVCGVPETFDTATVSVISNWDRLADEHSTITSSMAWALAVSPIENGAQWASLGVAGRTSDNRLHVEWLHHRKGTHWVVAQCVESQAISKLPLRVHSSGPEGALIAQLVAAGVTVVPVSSADVEKATGMFVAACEGDSPSLVHLGQPSLDKAVRGAVLRTGSNGAAIWSQRSSSVEITPLIACTVALGGVPQDSTAAYAGTFSSLDDYLEEVQ